MARISPLSGFPEWLPAERIVEQRILNVLRHTFELHGFSEISTRAVEPLSQLLRKGETSKEIYVLRRLQADDDGSRSKSGAELDGYPGLQQNDLGLHFDLTVPLARYVLENAGKLQFPFKRYQIQPVWRGERPQDGRFREFIQADIDVVGAGTLPAHYEIELPLVIAEAFDKLAEFGVPPIRISVNNRKVAEGFYRGLGLADVDEVLRVIDKLDKIGPSAVTELLVADGASPEQAAACLELAQLNGPDARVCDAAIDLARRYGADTDLFQAGIAELRALLNAAAGTDAVPGRARGVVVADFKIARGLDYYTGSVYETTLVGHEDLGSICSGGRYDTLASDGKTTYPGVGLSIGVSRLVSRLVQGAVTASRPVPTAVLVSVTSEETRGQSDAVAQALRSRGIPTEVAPSAAKFGKQIQYAQRRGIPFVWFLGEASGAHDGDQPGANTGPSVGAPGNDQVKDIRSGEQIRADARSWQPPAADWWPYLRPGASVG